jgi:hypothetical protein
MASPEQKGAGFLSLLKVVRTRLPPPAFADLMKRLPKDTQHLIEHPPLPVAWIANHHGRLLLDELYHHVLRKNDAELEEIARLALMADLNSIYRMFIRFASPQYVIDRGSRIWETYTRNNGRVRAEATSKNSCDVFYEDIAETGAAFWVYQRGAIRGVLAATGMKDIAVEIVAGGSDTGSAKFAVRWR